MQIIVLPATGFSAEESLGQNVYVGFQKQGVEKRQAPSEYINTIGFISSTFHQVLFRFSYYYQLFF
jgi:hypothetical protein